MIFFASKTLLFYLFAKQWKKWTHFLSYWTTTAITSNQCLKFTVTRLIRLGGRSMQIGKLRIWTFNHYVHITTSHSIFHWVSLSVIVSLYVVAKRICYMQNFLHSMSCSSFGMQYCMLERSPCLTVLNVTFSQTYLKIDLLPSKWWKYRSKECSFNADLNQARPLKID